jgi:hypothetical protein
MLNPVLDIPYLPPAYAQRKVISMPNNLKPVAAEDLHRVLKALVWNLERNDYGPSQQIRMPLTQEIKLITPSRVGRGGESAALYDSEAAST